MNLREFQSKGGKERARKLTKARRREIALLGVAAKRKKAKLDKKATHNV